MAINKDSLQNYEFIKDSLKKLNIDFYEDNSLVRGLDYYCNTVFEFKTEALGSQDTLIGGGRYDGLIQNLGGKNIPGIGWAGGVERLSLLMKDVENISSLVHIAVLNEDFKDHALTAYNLLVENNISVYWSYKYNLKKSLSNANNSKASHIIIVGDNEYKENKFTVKNLKTGEQNLTNHDTILNFIK